MSSTINASTASGGGLITSADASGILQLQTAGVTGLTIDGSQNVGIGTSSPAAKLDVTGNAAVSGQIMAGTTTAYSDGSIGTPKLQFNTVNGAYVGAVSIADTTSASSHLVLRNPNGNIAAIGTNGTSITFSNPISSERMRIDSSGNVGIGTSSPSKILHVYTANGNGIYVEDGSSAMPSPTIRVRGWRSDTNGSQTFGGGLVLERKGDSATANGTVLGTIYFGGNYNTTPNFGYAASISGISDGAFTSSTNTPTALTFYTGVTPNLDTNTANVYTGTERMRIDSAGNLLVGTATVSAVGSRLSIKGSAAVWGCGPTSGNDSFFVYNASSVGVYLANGGTSWSSSSDERLKTELTPIENGLDKVNSLRSVTGRFKTDEVGTSRSFLIAQDVQKVLPEAVSVQDDELGTLGVAYTEVIPLLVASIKELKAIIDTQTDTINNLTTRLETLEGVV